MLSGDWHSSILQSNFGGGKKWQNVALYSDPRGSVHLLYAPARSSTGIQKESLKGPLFQHTAASMSFGKRGAFSAPIACHKGSGINVYFPASKSEFPPVWPHFPLVRHIFPLCISLFFQSKSQNVPARSFVICSFFSRPANIRIINCRGFNSTQRLVINTFY